MYLNDFLNVEKFLEEKDITINLRHILDFGDGDFEVFILNTDTMVHNMDELVRIAGRYI